MSKHTHAHANIKQTMHPALIKADVSKAFAFHPDTIVFNEVRGAAWTRITSEAKVRGYGTYRVGEVVLAWKSSRFRLNTTPPAKAFRLAHRGRKKVTPNRYVVRARLVDKITGERVQLVGTHMISSGWSGPKHLDAWRRGRWYKHAAAMLKVLKGASRWAAVTYWSGDLNRNDPKAIARAFYVPGMKTNLVVHTRPTHGKVTFDYTGAISHNSLVSAVNVNHPLHSDHDLLLTTYSRVV